MTSSTSLRAAIIGCGGRGRAQADGYAQVPDAQIVAVADPVAQAALDLAQKHAVPSEGVHTDYRELLQSQPLDMLSICTWPAQHAEQVLAAIGSGVRAILCEKPMAPTMGQARAMHQAATKADVQLSFCHQRRFDPQFVRARQLIRDGAIGKVRRLEGFCPNLFDWGTHWFDIWNFLNEEAPAETVMGQIDISDARTVFGAWVESSGLSYVHFSNGVDGLMSTGRDQWNEVAIRVIGEGGILEVPKPDGGDLRLLRFGHDWEIATLKGLPAGDATILSVQDVAAALREGREAELSSRKALQATELIFATYESARRGAKIKLPLEIDDSPLVDLIEQRDAALQSTLK